MTNRKPLPRHWAHQRRNPARGHGLSPQAELELQLAEDRWGLRLARMAGLPLHVARHERAIRCLEMALAGVEGGLP